MKYFRCKNKRKAVDSERWRKSRLENRVISSFFMFTSEVMVFNMSKVVRILIKTIKNQLPFGQIDRRKIILKTRIFRYM